MATDCQGIQSYYHAISNNKILMFCCMLPQKNLTTLILFQNNHYVYKIDVIYKILIRCFKLLSNISLIKIILSNFSAKHLSSLVLHVQVQN